MFFENVVFLKMRFLRKNVIFSHDLRKIAPFFRGLGEILRCFSENRCKKSGVLRFLLFLEFWAIGRLSVEFSTFYPVLCGAGLPATGEVRVAPASFVASVFSPTFRF